MFDNNTYNLMKQLVVEHKSLWRIKKHYKDDSGDDAQSKEFWSELENDKGAYIKKLAGMLKERMS